MSQVSYRQSFIALEQWLRGQLLAGEQFSLAYSAEDSQFIRFNHGLVRQASEVRQIEATVRLISNQRHASESLNLTGDADSDCARLTQTLAQLRELLAILPADPYLQLDHQAFESHRESAGNLPDAAQLIEQVTALSDGLDMVGIYAGGPMYRGFASSWGAHGWHAAVSASLDFSLYHANGEAVKITYAASEWDAGDLAAQFAQGREQLIHLGKPRKPLAPGQYRTYLAPAALNSIIGTLRGGFSARALNTRRSPLQALQLGTASFSPQLNLSERASTGLEPLFSSEGSLRQDQTLVERGQLAGQLVSSRSAREYGLPANGVDDAEHPSSLVMAGGDLPTNEVLQALGTGLYIGNLWYLNYSDVGSARITGLTRFASFWVEDGQIVAPIDTMRFDDSLYAMLGDNLLALTREQSLRISTRTFMHRDAQTVLLPGALIDRFTLTL
ncbi:metallopeptidase TldD-related protein [Pseudomonas sp. 21LCFQ02]|uniref:TldD/PmbA family protein n=1 Tax=Pseudomonas sp. 21LCFQ02 TaxID=2957505 RepID=UPI00209AD98B|nr:metallopeptidase TldD-related protein [Pseudomonas sp. 21LCFQ02]MCO8170949.1 metallopeptidase TldD-related protein [Pseudomonas sp. 21LCFQ02]